MIYSPEYQANGKTSSEMAEILLDETFKKGYSKFDWVHRKSDGTIFYVEIMIVKIILSGQNSVFAALRDVTAQKNAVKALTQNENTLRDINATKDKFFSIIAHDLKSPFNALLNLSSMLLTEYSDLTEKEKLSFIESIEEISSSSYNLLENLLEWAGMQTGKIKFIPEKLNLLVEIYPTLKLLIQTASNKNIQIKYEIDKMIEIVADKNMFTTIIRNLVSNSIKFTNLNGLIELKAEK